MKKLYSREEGEEWEGKLDFFLLSIYLYSLTPQQDRGDCARWAFSGNSSRSYFLLTPESLLLILPKARKIMGLPSV
jgi:hypothetical protein